MGLIRGSVVRPPRVRNERWIRLPSTVVVLISWAVLCCGCNDRHQEIEIAVTPINQRILPPKTEIGSKTTGKANEQSDSSLTEQSTGITQADLFDHLGKTDATENLDFFSPPSANEVQSETLVKSSDRVRSLRLLGFVNAEPQRRDSTIAIIKIGEKLVYLQRGEHYDTVSVNDIDPVARSVTVRNQGDLHTLHLRKQAILNEPTTPPDVRTRNAKLRGASPRGRASSNDALGVPGLHAPIDPPVIPDPISEESGSRLPLPDPVESFELPEIPDLEGLSDELEL